MIAEASRIAVVQYGDYLSASRLVREGARETYSGMRHSIEALQRLFGEEPHLVISLGSNRHRETVGSGISVGIPSPPRRFWRRGILNRRLWSRQVCDELASFDPTHLLMRAADFLALDVLRCGAKKGWNTLAMFANAFFSESAARENTQRELADLLNSDLVWRVGNHRAVSAQSMIDRGVKAEKVIAYDWPTERTPSQYKCKVLSPGAPVEVVFAGNMARVKGIGDLIEAVGMLRKQGKEIRLTAFGAGQDFEEMRVLAEQVAPAVVEFPGQVENDVLFERLRCCTVACVTTRPEFQEGGSLMLTEALASRTPVVLSDQTMFRKSFKDGEGVRLFRAGDPRSLAEKISGVTGDEVVYARLSESTVGAFARVQCSTTFADVLGAWKTHIEAKHA